MTSGEQENRTLLVVDDDVAFRTRLMRAFQDRGFEVAGAGSVDEALAVARLDTPAA
jgi:two-component system, response regulator RegA